MCRAIRQPFVHEVSVRGELESAVNANVRCEVRSRSFWTTILEVVPEGTRVEPGDFLVRLDSSGLELELHEQKLLCDRSEWSLIYARNYYETCANAARLYEQGEYRLARQAAEMALLLAENRESQARRFYENSRVLTQQGYITPKQLEADQFDLQAAVMRLEAARLRLDILETCTRPKRLKRIEGALNSSKAGLASAEFWHQTNLKRLAEIQEQIDKCVICAPVAGKVVLAHLHHDDHSHRIEPGARVWQKQVLVRLPDPAHMQARVLVEESKVGLVRAGLPVTMRLEAFPGVELPGEVVRVHEYPEPEDWYGSGIKKYEAIVRIEKSLAGLKPGMTAELTILIQRLENELQVPCQAVLARGDKDYCLRVENGRWEAREVTVGPSNDTRVVIRSGLEDGDEIVLSAATHGDKVELPEMDESSSSGFLLASNDPRPTPASGAE
ncbi:MAG: HlyD family efflux transporter periplasmic adaptor subunit [Pirellulales bacterium]|nr:HlyD family efflux transporter periplasmic adaptor subunit [Pirellulales bacterium]